MSRTRGRPSSRFFKDRRVIYAAAVVLGLAAAGAGFLVWNGSSGRPCAADYPGKHHSDICADASGTVTLDDFTVSATPLASSDNGNGGLALCSDVTLSNNTADKHDFNAGDFTIQNPAGEARSPDERAIDGALRSGSLGPGGTKTAKVCDDRPVQKGQYALIYAPSLFDTQRGVWLASR